MDDMSTARTDELRIYSLDWKNARTTMDLSAKLKWSSGNMETVKAE